MPTTSPIVSEASIPLARVSCPRKSLTKNRRNDLVPDALSCFGLYKFTPVWVSGLGSPRHPPLERVESDIRPSGLSLTAAPFQKKILTSY
jgi:hypothetical protein